jgi:glycosyltransferase involved in cell wall biosynthesis
MDRSRRNYQDKKRSFTAMQHLVFVPVSDWLSEIVAQSYLKKCRIKRIYNGIDTAIFTHRNSRKDVFKRFNLKADFLIIGVAAIWSQRKGLQSFIQLSLRIPDNYMILLVGLSEEQIRQLPKNIIGLSRTENIEELVELYSASDVYVSCSLEETFGLTTVEAMACGVPVVVFNATTSPELVTPETGFVVESGNMDEVLQSIKIIEQNGKAFYAEHCRNHVIENFSKEDTLQKYMQLYTEIVK